MQPGPISRKLSNRFVAAMLCTVATMAFFIPQSSFASDVRVISSGAVREVVEEAVPIFESSSGHKLAISWAGSADIRKRVAAGETYDVVVASRSDIEGFIKAEKVSSDSALGLMKSGVGIAVKDGDPKPDVSTMEGFRTALLRAKSIGYSTGPSGTYLDGLFVKLGIADEIKARLRTTPSGVAVGTLLVKGDADIGLQQVSELIHYPGVTYVGPLPSDIQYITEFTSGLGADAKDPGAAKALLSFLASPATRASINFHGMSPSD